MPEEKKWKKKKLAARSDIGLFVARLEEKRLSLVLIHTESAHSTHTHTHTNSQRSSNMCVSAYAELVFEPPFISIPNSVALFSDGA